MSTSGPAADSGKPLGKKSKDSATSCCSRDDARDILYGNNLGSYLRAKERKIFSRHANAEGRCERLFRSSCKLATKLVPEFGNRSGSAGWYFPLRCFWQQRARGKQGHRRDDALRVLGGQGAGGVAEGGGW